MVNTREGGGGENINFLHAVGIDSNSNSTTK